MGSERVDDRLKVRNLIQQAGVAILVTAEADGAHAGRPMLPLLLEDDPHIYFLTHQSSNKVTQIAVRPQVSLAITASDRYVVVIGRAVVVRDPEMIRRLWHPTYRAWFPDGTDDREAAVLRVDIERVDYWQPPRSRLARIAQAVRAVLTRRAIETPKKTLNGI